MLGERIQRSVCIGAYLGVFGVINGPEMGVDLIKQHLATSDDLLTQPKVDS